jgi:uncharacterized damage-inducible protein DinB
MALMTIWTAPTPPEPHEGALVGIDRAILEDYLAWERRTLLNICAGLTGEQLAQRALPPSSLSLLGLVRHLAKVERTWFRERVVGEQHEPMYAGSKDADFDDLDPAVAEVDFERFRAECRLADEAAAGRDFDATFELGGDTYSLRLVYVHMVAEYARHNGHADLLRERIDGTIAR